MIGAIDEAKKTAKTEPGPKAKAKGDLERAADSKPKATSEPPPKAPAGT
jgi:hypothetical protein